MPKFLLLILIGSLSARLTAQISPAVPFAEKSLLSEINSFEAPESNQRPSHNNRFTLTADFKPDFVGQKSVGLALLMSLALPGAGEFYMGQRGQGTFFLSSEIVIWSGLVLSNLYAGQLKDETYVYAAQHAGVLNNGKDKQYWIDIGKYNSLYEFNEQRRRDRFFEDIYPENAHYNWFWDEENNRLRYDGKRIRANEIANQDVYFYASILLNHLVSGINAMRLARKHNRKLIEEANWSLRFKAHSQENRNKYYGLDFSTSF